MKSSFDDRQNTYPEIEGAVFYISPAEKHRFVNEYLDQNKLISEYSKQLWADDRTYVVGGSGNLTLVNNIYAKNPTRDELFEFLRKDQTDSNDYSYDSYVCADFAVDLHNAAERNGIACVIVMIDFKDEPEGHMLDGFIVDGQWVFIDDTTHPGNHQKNMDHRTYPEIGKPYTGEYLFHSDYRSRPMGTVSSIAVID